MWWLFLIILILVVTIGWILVPFSNITTLPSLSNLNISYNQDFIFLIENPNEVDVDVNLTFSQFDVEVYNTNVHIASKETINFNLYTGSNRAEGFTYGEIAQIKSVAAANGWSGVAQQYGFLIPINDLILNNLTTSVDKYLNAAFDDWIQITRDEYINMGGSLNFRGVETAVIESETSQGFAASSFANYVTGDPGHYELEPGNYICALQFRTYSTNDGPFQIVFVPAINTGFPDIDPGLNYLNVNIIDELEPNTMYSYVMKGSLSYSTSSEANANFLAFWPQNQCFIGIAPIGNQEYSRTLNVVEGIAYPNISSSETTALTSNTPVPLMNFLFYPEPQWVHPSL